MAAISLPSLRIPRVKPLALAGWAAIWAFLLLFVLYPLTRIFYDAFTTDAGGFTVANFIDFFTDRYYLRSLWKSLVLGVLVVITTSVLGISVALLLLRYEFPGRNLFSYLTMLPLIMPPLVACSGSSSSSAAPALSM